MQEVWGTIASEGLAAEVVHEHLIQSGCLSKAVAVEGWRIRKPGAGGWLRSLFLGIDLQRDRPTFIRPCDEEQSGKNSHHQRWIFEHQIRHVRARTATTEIPDR